MVLIDGVGDEVTLFFMAVLCGAVTLLAWWSTGNTGYGRDAFGPVGVGERNVRLLYRIFAVRAPRNLNDRNPVPTDNATRTTAARNDSNATEEEISESPSVQQGEDDDSNTLNASPSSENAETTAQDVEIDNILNAMDTDSSELRNRRLAFFDNRSSPSEATSSNARETTSPESVRNGDDSDGNSELETKSESDEIESENIVDKPKDNIRVRLKFLNDDLKEVEGSLREQIGEFKRRHFQGELGACKLVRLIFNGQVLQREGATLESCGLFDNCVVHCLVHQPRNAAQFAQAQQQLGAGGLPDESTTNDIPQFMDHLNGIPQMNINNSEEREWDLSNILLTMLASILSIAWYCHIRFSSMFGLAASIAMLGLTTIYLMAVICVYFPDNNNTVNHPPPAPAPNEPPREAQARAQET